MYNFLKGKQAMKSFKYLFVFLLIMTLMPINVSAHTKPDDISFSDFSGIVSDGAKDYVKSKNNVLFAATGAKIIFVTTDTTDGLSANEYAKNLYSLWNIGQLGRGNSVLIVMSAKTKDYGVIQGKNINRVLTDSVLYKCIAEAFEPNFAKENYDDAVLTLYNKLGRWYEENYSGLNLYLDSNIDKYKTQTITKDTEKTINPIYLWIGFALLVIIILTAYKVKRHKDFKSRQKERKLKRKRVKANIDKIVNS